MGDLLDPTVLDMENKDPVTPAPAGRAPSPEPREEEPISLLAPNELPTSEPKEAAHSEELAPVQRRLSLASPWVYPFMGSQVQPTLFRGCGLAGRYTPGSPIDLSSLGSLQVTISHYPAMGEVQYQYQSWVIAQISLQLTLSKPSDQLDCPPQIEELRVNTTLPN